MHLGDHRSRSDRKAQRVAIDQLRLPAGMVDSHGIDQQMVGLNRKPLDRLPASPSASPGRCSRDRWSLHRPRPRRTASATRRIRRSSRSRSLRRSCLESFRPALARPHSLRQDDCSRHDRPEQSAAAYFIHAGDHCGTRSSAAPAPARRCRPAASASAASQWLL